jgi:hypothetical protein
MRYCRDGRTTLWWCLHETNLDTTLRDRACDSWWFSPGTLVSSTIKTDGHDITEILLKVALSTITPILHKAYVLTLWVRILLRRGILDTTLCDKVCQWLVAGRWFSPDTPVSPTNKTTRHDITEILLKVALNTITLTLHETNLEKVDFILQNSLFGVYLCLTI